MVFQRKARGDVVVAVLALITAGAFFSVPYLSHYLKTENYQTTEKALSSSQVRRGAYLNTGSKDIGPDPDYDAKTRTWNGGRASDRGSQRND
uniref:Uncharacterized protein AlNc14C59G4372 n=1 Tax=Albugo laibachii Nc14 TaxID=890382 RepID=F0WCJ2_9STRA|nr:hypothetical protein PITG_19672 [Albugo laibachii Nc14]|eukprot:CCA18909.1 hypothetical protein PITG_19672 [Albugo laibachii Nc14]